MQKNKKREVSIIMPAYNAEKYIEEAIRSVMTQTYKEWELIVINDCSADNTEQVVLKIAAEDERIRYLKNNVNLGVSESRNKGIKCSRNDWVAFLDSDDFWVADKLEKQLQLCKRYEEGKLFFTGSGFVNANGKKSSYVLRVPEKIKFRRLLKQNVISCSSVLAQKELLLKYPMTGDFLHEDFAVWLKILKESKYAYAVDEPLLIYRLSEQSKSSDKKKAAWMTWQVYRTIGLNIAECLYYFIWYTYKNLKKYRKIRKGFEENNNRS